MLTHTSITALAVAALTTAAHAGTFGFGPASPEVQGNSGFFVTVESAGATSEGTPLVSFHVFGDARAAGVITAMNFEHTGQLGELVHVYNGPGVAFVPLPSLLDLPVAPGKSLAAMLRSSTSHSAFIEGAGANEYVRLVFTLAPGSTADDVDEAISNQQLQVGLAVQQEGAEPRSLVTVPSPGSMALIAAGTLCCARRKRKHG
jgi:hypothetical protein